MAKIPNVLKRAIAAKITILQERAITENSPRETERAKTGKATLMNRASRYAKVIHGKEASQDGKGNPID